MSAENNDYKSLQIKNSRAAKSPQTRKWITVCFLCSEKTSQASSFMANRKESYGLLHVVLPICFVPSALQELQNRHNHDGIPYGLQDFELASCKIATTKMANTGFPICLVPSALQFDSLDNRNSRTNPT